MMDEEMDLSSQLEEMTRTAERYRFASEAFEKRVLDLQRELQQKNEEIERLKEQKKQAEMLRQHRATVYSSESGLAKQSEGPSADRMILRKLFIGGLNGSTTEEQLGEHFGQYGAIESCTVMKDASTGKSRGFAFIVFSDPSAVDEVQQARPHYVDSKQVETKRAIPEAEMPAKSTILPHADKGGPGSKGRRKVFVGGLKSSTDQDSLRSYFEAFGPVENVSLMEDRATKKSRGFAYVTFDDPDHADKVILQKYHTIDDHRVEVKRARSMEEMSLQRTGMPFVHNTQNNYATQQGTWVPAGQSEPSVRSQGWESESCSSQGGGSNVNLLQLAALIGNFAQSAAAGGGAGGNMNQSGASSVGGQYYGAYGSTGQASGGGESSYWSAPPGGYGSNEDPSARSNTGGKNAAKMKPRVAQRAAGPYGAGYGYAGNNVA